MTAADTQAAPAKDGAKPARRRFADRLSPINQRRWANFRANRRGFYSLWIFLFLYILSLGAELIANDKPLIISYKGELYFPLVSDYSEKDFGGFFDATLQDYKGGVIECLVRYGGHPDCDTDEPEEAMARLAEDPSVEADGWMVWPLIPWSYETRNKTAERLPAPPSGDNLLGTDSHGRDVLAWSIYAFRISVSFGLIVTAVASVIGVLAGAVQGYFGGWVDLVFQRFIEIWTSAPILFVILITASVFAPNFWILTIIATAFSWTTLVGVVRAEFLRARNFEYVRAAAALGVTDRRIMLRHVLPNALVATITLLPFALTSSISLLATLDFLGFGLGQTYPSLGQLALEAKSYLQAPWLGISAFVTFTIMLSLLVFVFEAVRDAFDPRKTFA